MWLIIKRITAHILRYRPWYDISYLAIWLILTFSIISHYPHDMWGDMVTFYMVLYAMSHIMIVSVLQKIAGVDKNTPMSQPLASIPGASIFSSYMEKRRMRRSFESPVLAPSGRDSITYYENGRSVVIHSELMQGYVRRRVDCQNLKWSDNGAELTETEKAKVLDMLCEHYDYHKIKWEYIK